MLEFKILCHKFTACKNNPECKILIKAIIYRTFSTICIQWSYIFEKRRKLACSYGEEMQRAEKISSKGSNSVDLVNNSDFCTPIATFQRLEGVFIL